MKNKRCYLCSGARLKKIRDSVRDIPHMPVLQCSKCGLVFLGNFGHINDKFYEESRMRQVNMRSPKVYIEEYLDDDLRRAAWLKNVVKDKSVLDFGCGAGTFLDNVKQFTKKCAGVEKDKNLKRFIEKKLKIRVWPDISEVDSSFDCITLFHVLEHCKDPKSILTRLAALLKPGGSIIIELPNADEALLSLYGCDNFREHAYWGCHLYMFNKDTLKMLIESAGLAVNHISQIQRYPLSNHLYWLTHGKPGGHKVWNFLNNRELNKAYEEALAGMGKCDTIVASVGKKQ